MSISSKLVRRPNETQAVKMRPSQLVAEIIVHGRFDRLGRAVARLVQRPRDLLVPTPCCRPTPARRSPSRWSAA
jgi:hypothetical protein